MCVCVCVCVCVIDIDECSSKTDDCSQFATCTNTDGSYECTCLDGYQGNGRRCIGGLTPIDYSY